MTPADDLPTTSTAGFLLSHLGPPVARVLEVGCGNGAVAALLRDAGHEVIAVDSDPSMVAAARSRGLDARCAHWPDFAADGFSAVAFTRSLHHIVPLTAALQQASRALRPGGVLLIEDYAVDAIDDATLRWFIAALHDLDGNGHVQNRPSELACKLLAADDPTAVWQRDHDHDLHPFPAIEAAVHALFRPGRQSETPYLFRYVAAVLAAGNLAKNALRTFFDEEEHRGSRGQIQRLGRRLVAHAAPA